MLVRNVMFLTIWLVIIFFSRYVIAEDSRLLATGGVTQVEGSAGGGIVPWAVISGYANEGEIGFTLVDSHLSTDDFKLDVYGIAIGIDNRYEISFTEQSFDLGPLQTNLGLPSNKLKQSIVGAKVKLFGDLLYQSWPQISLGMQYKKVEDFTIPNLVGATDSSGTDIYLSASKLWLNGVAGIPLLVNATVRSTEANQMGLLGFGGDLNTARKTMWEINTSLLITRKLVVGYEFRQKPDNLSFAREQHWQDVYLAWFYDKSISGVLAWVDIGSVAGLQDQQGLYLSFQATF